MTIKSLIAAFQHRKSLILKAINKGYPFPFGHKAALIKLTEPAPESAAERSCAPAPVPPQEVASCAPLKNEKDGSSLMTIKSLVACLVTLLFIVASASPVGNAAGSIPSFERQALVCSTYSAPVAAGNMIVLTSTDVLNLKKIASTEVVPSLKGEAFTSQTHAVIDTVLNRLASGKWGDTVAEVGNAPWQFSGINSTLPTAYGSLEKMPARHINAKVAREVDRWLAERAAGAESSVGNHLNYLNPLYSSAKSLKGWGRAVVQQAKKEGLVFGAGLAKHYHGTSADNEPWRPGEFLIALEELAFNG